MIPDNPVVLLVDDSETDALLMSAAFQRAGFVEPLRFVNDGQEMISYIQGDGRYADRALFPVPTVVLMDLKMPYKSGFEVLEWIRRQPQFKRLRVYILSASNEPEDIARAYDLGANSYLVKPSNLDALSQMAKYLLTWLKVSHFPPALEKDAAYENAPRVPAETQDDRVDPMV